MTSSSYTSEGDTIRFRRPPGLTDGEWKKIRENVADFLERAGCKRVAA